MAIRRSARKPRNESEPIQKDLLAQVHPLCPECKGEGRYLYYQAPGKWTQTDWASLKFCAQALGTWDMLVQKEPHFAEHIEKKMRRGRFIEGDKYFKRCPRCGGSGHITPEYESHVKKLRAFTNSCCIKAIEQAYGPQSLTKLSIRL